MRKAILFAAIMCIILVVSAYGNDNLTTAPKPLGNTSGNIANGGIVSCQDEWVYYSNYNDEHKLYKTKPDGSENQKITDEQVREISILNDKIYYTSLYFGKDIEGIYSINLDGSDKQRLIDDRAGYINVTEDRIYYIYWDRNFAGRNEDTDDSKIYSIKLDGTDRQKHNDDYTIWLNVIGDRIYYQSIYSSYFRK